MFFESKKQTIKKRDFQREIFSFMSFVLNIFYLLMVIKTRVDIRLILSNK